MKKIICLIALLMLTFGNVYAQDSHKKSTIDPEEHKIISSDRADGRYLSTRGLVQYMMRNIQPRLAFNPQFSKEEFKVWQNQVRLKMQELINFPEIPPQPLPKLISKKKKDGYTLEKWEIYPQPGSVVPFLMLIPDGISAENPAPAVLSFCGSTRTKESTAGEDELNPIFLREKHYDRNRMAMYYAEKGFVSIVVDNPGIGETSDLEKYGQAPAYDRNTFSRYLLHMGLSYMGLSAFQGQKVLDWMKGLDFIDNSRIAISGHSLGTEPLMVLAVLNPDIHAIVFNDFMGRNIRRAIVQTKPTEAGVRPVANWLGHCVPGLWNWFDYPDIVASFAPRPLILTEGGAVDDLDLIKHAYKIMDAEDSIAIFHYPKYQDPKNRLHDHEFIPEGLDMDEYFQYVNVDAPNHYFKSEIAVPWLENIFKNKR